MIGWLRGEVAEPWQQANRCGLLLICQGVGYELQITARQMGRLPPAGEPLELHVHLSIREDGWVLHGFGSRQERDLFRELVAVSGVGPQMAMGLLSSLTAAELAKAIVQADLRSLMQAQGVGRRTAERLAVELRSRLQERFPELLRGAAVGAEALPPSENLPAGQGREELQLTLMALGYEILEIDRAIRAVAAEGSCGDGDTDAWIRECLRWLSGPAA